MSDVIGRGVIENVVDNTKLNAGINEAKRTVRSLGDASRDSNTKASQSIDRYVKRLEVQNATLGKSERETELYKLALRGASAEQLKAADTALKLTEAYHRGEVIGNRIRTGFIATAAAGTLAIGVITGMAISGLNAADQLNDLSVRTGIAVEQLAGLSYVAKLGDTDLQGLADSISKLSMNMGKNGEKFRALGVDARDPLEAFKQFADIFNAIEDPQTRAALGAAALGKSWQSAAPVMAEGSKRIGEMVEKGTRLSGVTQDLADDASRLNDELDTLKFAASGLSTKLAGEMVPAFTQILTAIKTAYEESGKLSALWTGMGALGAFLFTDEFASNTVKIKKLRDELGGLESERKQAEASPAVGIVSRYLFGEGKVSDYDKRIASVKSQIKGLEDAMKPQKVVAPPKTKEQRERDAKKEAEDRKRAQAFINDENKRNAAEAAQLSKAQLDLEVSSLRTASEYKIAIYANSERIISARRAAGLIDEKDFFTSRINMLQLQTSAQEEALQGEIDLLRQQDLTGKDSIDNLKRIAEAQAKLTTLRENSVASLEVLSIQETAQLQAIEQGWRDAEDAATEYLNSIRNGFSRELSGMGLGNTERDRRDGRAQIEDRYTQQRRELERSRRDAEFAGTFGAEAQKRYDSELDRIRRFQSAALSEYDNYFAERLRLEGDWSIGASDAINNYFDNARNVAAATEDLFANAFGGMEDALVSFVTTGKLDFKSLADSIIADVVRIQMRQALSGLMGGGGSSSGGAIFGLLGMAMGAFSGAGAAANPGAGANGLVNWTASNPLLAGRAIGGPVSANQLYRVNEKGPELLNVAGKQYLMMGNQSGSVDAKGGAGGTVFSPTFHIDSRTDRAAILQDVRRATQEANAQFADRMARSNA